MTPDDLGSAVGSQSGRGRGDFRGDPGAHTARQTFLRAVEFKG
ncbi:hypothetical protein RLDS_10800 [Sphingobium lactosutens DS20]|uniref:Uncharacterized protein n=1 Tax=Sphingobium lactosutens DS20 TaxID=1331060 RepID=T0HUD8_9SPHN|nr:hypothetical protein RLDS_10800 [Sphingobium lactosutens DS20]